MLRPMDDKIVIKVLEAIEKTQGGIYIPQQSQEKPAVGTVMAVGPGAILPDGSRGPMEVKVGDKVAFMRFGGNVLKLEEGEFKLISIRDVLGVHEVVEVEG